MPTTITQAFEVAKHYAQPSPTTGSFTCNVISTGLNRGLGVRIAADSSLN